MNFKIVSSIVLCGLLFRTATEATNGEVVGEPNRSYNILGVFHFPSQSHHILGSTLLKELARRGHNVTMISPFPFDEKIPNYTDIELEGLAEFKEELMRRILGDDSFRMCTIARMLFTVVPQLGELVLGQRSFRNLLESDSRFDLIVLPEMTGDFLLGLSHRFDAPIVLFSGGGSNSELNMITGNIGPYSYVPNPSSTFTDRMTFVERVQNVVYSLLFRSGMQFIALPQFAALSRKYFPSAPPLAELYDNVALALVNSHFSTESPRPYTPNMIQIGGFHAEAVDPLPKDLQKYLDESTDGVVYFSFGTNVKASDWPQDKIDVFVRTFARIKQNVLWKFEGERDLPPNVRVAKWLPQKAILNHPNTRAFISHGGLGSVLESVRAAVPMLIVPFFADQNKNAANAASGGYAIRLQLNELAEGNVAAALASLLNDPSYEAKVALKSSLLTAQPMKQMDKAVYWVEHVVRFKRADHLKPASLKLNLMQELCLDVFAFLFAVVGLSVYLIYLLIRTICKARKRCKPNEKRVKDKRI